MWSGNPRIAKPGESGNFQQIVNGPSCRPYHLSHNERQWQYRLSYRPTPGEIFFTHDEEEFGKRHAGRIIIEPHIKHNASPNKQWGWVRWAKVAWLIDEKVTQFGSSQTPLLDGAEVINSPTFRHAAAVLKYARVAILPEGGLHHAAAAVGLPAVVVFGGFTPIELTGYEGHVNLGASLGDACGMRVECEHCTKVMASIDPVIVANEAKRLLNGSGHTPRVSAFHPSSAHVSQPESRAE